MLDRHEDERAYRRIEPAPGWLTLLIIAMSGLVMVLIAWGVWLELH